MKSKGRKLSLIGTIFVSMLSVCSAGVSTFAWFQAQANVNITTTSTSTTISVAKPDEYSFYAYKYNALDTYGTTNNFASDFTEITSSTASTLTSTVGMNPGQSMVFCLKVTAATIGRPITLKINELISNTAQKQGFTYRRTVTSGSTIDINVGWAIDIYSMHSTDGTGYTGFLTYNKETSSPNTLTDYFDYGQNSLGELNSDGTGSSPNKIIDLVTGITIFNQNATATTEYVFYRVYFSNLATTFYRETNSTEGDNVEVLDDNREFTYAGDNTGTSNCYGGLKFQIINMELNY